MNLFLRKKNLLTLFLLCVGILLIAPFNDAQAIQITGITDPSAVVIDFTGQSSQSGGYDSLTLSGVTFSDDGGVYGNFNFDKIMEGFPPDVTYNDFLTADTTSDGISFYFSGPVSEFGFNYGGMTVDWTLTAYDSTGGSESYGLSDTSGPLNFNSFIGISMADIVSATLTATSELDFNIDNFTYVSSGAPIPEPATMFLLGSGLVGLAGFRRKKFKK